MEWWDGVEPEVEKLARKIAERHGHSPDTMCLPYQPSMFVTSSGGACMINSPDTRPLWTFEVAVARHALAAKDEQAVEDVVALPEQDNTFVDTWRTETGLDAQET